MAGGLNRTLRPIILFLALSIGASSAYAQLLQVSVQQVPVDNLPFRFECRDDEYPLVALVHNTSFIPRIIEVEAVLVDRDGRIVAVVPPCIFRAEVAAGERALLGECVSVPDRNDLGTVRLRAEADTWRVDRPLLLPFWLSVEEPTAETWQAEGGYHLRARATFLAQNRRRSDAWIAGRIRFYNAQGYQVALCGFEGRVLAGVATRLGCS